MSRTLFVDTDNFDLSEYEKGKNSLSFTNINLGLTSISEIQLTSAVVPSYLLDNNCINITLNVGDTDDKLEVKRENGNYLVTSYFAKILPVLTSDSYAVNWFFSQDPSSTPIYIAIGSTLSMNAEDSKTLPDASHTISKFHTIKNEMYLSKLVLCEGLKVFKCTISEVNGGIVFTNGGTANYSASIFPGIRYDFDLSNLPSYSFSIRCPTSSDIDSKLASFFTDIPNGKRLLIPKETLFIDFAIEFIFTPGTGTPVIVNMEFVQSAYSLYHVEVLRNGGIVIAEDVLVSVNSYATKICMLPEYLTDDDPLVLANGVSGYRKTITRLSKGDTLTYNITQALTDIALKPNYNFSQFTYCYNLETDSREMLYFKSSFVLDYMRYHIIKQSDLMFTSPTYKGNISSLNNFRLHFFNKKGNFYPILNNDRIYMSLKFYGSTE